MNACALKPVMPFVTRNKLGRTPATEDNREMIEFIDSHNFSFDIDVETKNLKNQFTCGNIVIDNFLKNGDALDEDQGITYVLLSDKKDAIIGYYNIEVGRVDQIEDIGNNVMYIPMGGAVNINYLAIDIKYQGTKIAEINGKKYIWVIICLEIAKRGSYS